LDKGGSGLVANKWRLALVVESFTDQWLPIQIARYEIKLDIYHQLAVILNRRFMSATSPRRVPTLTKCSPQSCQSIPVRQRPLWSRQIGRLSDSHEPHADRQIEMPCDRIWSMAAVHFED
jgi:hypothetical protein